jgi:hypothetical protein
MVTCLALVSLMVGGRHHCGGVVCRGRDHGVRRGARERGNSCLFVDNNPFSGLSQSSENEGNFWRTVTHDLISSPWALLLKDSTTPTSPQGGDQASSTRTLGGLKPEQEARYGGPHL